MAYDRPGNPNARQSHYRKEELDREPVVCPQCGSKAMETVTQYGIRSECCGLWSWNRYPLQTAEHHEAKRKAHEAFDTLWQSRIMSRNDAYRRLSQHIGRQAHMKEMTLDELRSVPEWVEIILKGDEP